MTDVSHLKKEDTDEAPKYVSEFERLMREPLTPDEKKRLARRTGVRKRDKFKLCLEGQSRIDCIKRDLCDLLNRIAIRNHWDQHKSAVYLGTTQSCVSHIFNHRYDKLTLNQLFRYLALVEPRFRFLIAI